MFLFFNQSVGFFGFKHFGRRFCGLSYEFRSIKKKNCFFNESVCFSGFRHLGKRFCGIFSYEFISVLETELFFSESVVFLASVILEDGSVAFFNMNL